MKHHLLGVGSQSGREKEWLVFRQLKQIFVLAFSHVNTVKSFSESHSCDVFRLEGPRLCSNK